jgi:transcriptional regulator with XRE-family HTH domain
VAGWIDRKIGRQLGRFRAAAGLTIEAAARALDIPHAELAAFENGGDRVPPPLLIEMGRLYGFTQAALFRCLL